MAEQSTSGQSIRSTEWSGTEERQREFKFVNTARLPPFQIRIHNGLDVEVTVDVRLTDSMDESRSRLEDPGFYIESRTIGWPPLGGHPGSQTEQDTLTLAAGTVVTYAIPSSWDIVQYRVTPTTSPSSGSVNLINMK